MKQVKSEESAQKAESDYYNSLMHLEKSRQDWETCVYKCCDTLEVRKVYVYVNLLMNIIL